MAVRTVDLGSVIGPQGPAGKAGPQGPRGRGSARLVIGTSQAGWAAGDCDYLCDGTADDVEINAAIQALPSTGGEIVILDGTYNISGPISVNKANVTLSGCGFGTRLVGEYDTFVCSVYASNCTVQNLFIKADGAVTIINISSAQHCVIQNNYLDGTVCEEAVIDVSGSNNIFSSNIIPGGATCFYVRGSKNVMIGNVTTAINQISGTGNIVANNAKG